jgi:hypothetical protein
MPRKRVVITLVSVKITRVWNSYSCVSACRIHSCACLNHSLECRDHIHACQNHYACGNDTLRVETIFARVVITLVSVIFTHIRVKITLVSGNHSACVIRTLRVVINLLRVGITLVCVVITFVRVVNTLIRVEITLGV